MRDRKNYITHSFFTKATALKPPHQYPGAEVKPGFTLVELMVVMSIIAMLLGILLPALGAARRTAYRTMCKENLHGCGVAFQMYLNDNQNIMPTIQYMKSIPTEDEKSHNAQILSVVLAKYLSGPQALKCPADRKSNQNSSYFSTEESSYGYNVDTPSLPPPNSEGPFNFQERKIGGKGITITRGGTETTILWQDIYILRDYYSFHGKSGSVGSVMYLYADNLIANRERDK
jgi:prepilin-type N-terminal cleavage/methylation domain-containing protein